MEKTEIKCSPEPGLSGVPQSRFGLSNMLNDASKMFYSNIQMYI